MSRFQVPLMRSPVRPPPRRVNPADEWLRNYSVISEKQLSLLLATVLLKLGETSIEITEADVLHAEQHVVDVKVGETDGLVVQIR